MKIAAAVLALSFGVFFVSCGESVVSRISDDQSVAEDREESFEYLGGTPDTEIIGDALREEMFASAEYSFPEIAEYTDFAYFLGDVYLGTRVENGEEKGRLVFDVQLSGSKLSNEAIVVDCIGQASQSIVTLRWELVQELDCQIDYD